MIALGSEIGHGGVLSIAFGAREVEDDFLGLVVQFLLDDAVGMQELVGDVGKNGGAAGGHAALGGLDEEAGKEVAQIFRGGEMGVAGEEVFGEVVEIAGHGKEGSLGFPLRVSLAKAGVGGLCGKATALAIGIAMLAAGVSGRGIAYCGEAWGFWVQDFCLGGLSGHGSSLSAGWGVHTPGILYECQNKGLAKWAIRICVKGKELMRGKNGKVVREWGMASAGGNGRGERSKPRTEGRGEGGV